MSNYAKALGKVAPENDNGLIAPHDQPAGKNDNGLIAPHDQPAGNTHHEAWIVTEADEARKRFATLAARAAIKGHVLQKLGSGYLLSRWGHVRHFIDLDTAEALIVRMEGGRT
jgi:hypothetical protein